MTKISEKNPFKIEEGIMMAGKRSVPEETRKFLKQSMLHLPVDKYKSIMVSSSIIDKKTTVGYLVRQLKLEMRTEFRGMKNCEYACKSILDMKKNYVGTRIYRIN